MREEEEKGRERYRVSARSCGVLKGEIGVWLSEVLADRGLTKGAGDKLNILGASILNPHLW